MRGEVSSMRESFGSLGFGLALAVMLVYLVMVVPTSCFDLRISRIFLIGNLFAANLASPLG